jgi:hypothetical protein
MTDKTEFLDLDAIVSAEVVVKLAGKEHKLKPLSVEDFIQNTIDQRALGAATQIEDEVELVLKMLNRAFPTLLVDDLRKVDLKRLWALLNFALEKNGSNQAKDEADAAGAPTENPQTAG